MKIKISGQKSFWWMMGLILIFFLAAGWESDWLQGALSGWSSGDVSAKPAPAVLFADETRTLQAGYQWLQQARETGNPDFYGQAEQVFQQVISGNPGQVDALNGMASICLSRHQFSRALEWGEQARAENPRKAYTYGILTDALVELGRYPEAVEMAQKMVNIRPDLGSYSRVSYLRELHGDLPGAIEAMQMAVASGGPHQENVNWCRIHLGNLHFLNGDLGAAEREYKTALYSSPGYGHALAGLGMAAAARGDYTTAIARYREAVKALPIGENYIALGEVFEAAGMSVKADSQYQAAQEILERELSIGMDVADEMARLLCRRGRNIDRAVQLVEEAYERRPTVNIAYILAGALDAAGKYEQAREYARKSLRLQSPYPRFHYQLGVIEHHLGNGEGARSHLKKSLEMNPYFSPVDAPRALALLTQYQSRIE